MIAGLYHNFQRLSARLCAEQPTDTEPRIAHIDTVSKEQIRMERDKVAAAILECEAVENEIHGLINRMLCAPHGSANLTLAMRHLEDAQSRVRRELGDVPMGSLKPEIGGRRREVED